MTSNLEENKIMIIKLLKIIEIQQTISKKLDHEYISKLYKTKRRYKKWKHRKKKIIVSKNITWYWRKWSKKYGYIWIN